ncbi:MAG TPA: hypothetical protein VJU54_07050 [Nitrospiraceae bacterium]|nr:hypothetical protein [Nitrospiraceae bacterium]
MKRWYLYLLIVPLGLGIYFIVTLNSPIHLFDRWNRDTEAKNSRSDAGKMPEVEAVHRDILELRRAHQLRPLTTLEDGAKIQDLPNGIYGFSMCGVESLRAKRGNTFSLEIHKHDDGIVYYVGYAADDQIGKYFALQKNFHIFTFPHPMDKASSLFEIPVDFVSKCEERPAGNGYLFDLFVTSIPELQT